MEIDSAKHRAKVYELIGESQWEDKGTGQCSCEYVESQDDVCIMVHSENDDSVVLNNKIVKEDIYQKQQDTLIVWTEPSDGRDLALSFEKFEGCLEIWEQICDVQRRLGSVRHEDMFSDSPEMSVGTPVSLPVPTLGNLEEIENTIKMASQSVYGRDKLANYIHNTNYIEKLIPLLETCEDMEAKPELYRLCNTMKGIVLLNDNGILDMILRDDMILGVVGMLEHDPDYPNVEFRYREYLSNTSKFRQVVPIRDPKLEAKIHQTFRVQYLKDVVLARILDDPTFSILNSKIFFNHVDIVNMLQQDTAFLQELFDVLESPSEKPQRKKDVVLFVHQFCTIAKNLQQINRVGLYRALSQYGLFRIFDFALIDADPQIRMAGAEVLAAILDHDPALVRSYILAQIKEGVQTCLMEVLVNRFLDDDDLGVKAQYVEVIRILLDTASASGGQDGLGGEVRLPPKADEESTQFLEMFYNQYIKRLCAPILELNSEGRMDRIGEFYVMELERMTSALCLHLCELLSFAVRYHSFRSKQFILSSVIMQKIALLLRSREKHLRLAAIRFFRNIVGVKDDFYNRHLIKHDLFAPLVQAFLETENRDNLVNSACIELVDFIRKENIKTLIDHLCKNFGRHFQNIDYVDTFQQLNKRHEQNLDAKSGSLGPADGTSANGRPGRPEKNGWGSATMDEDEEKYFNAPDDEEDGDVTPGPNRNGSQKPSKKRKGGNLVDYPDDDDEETPRGQAFVEEATLSPSIPVPPTGMENTERPEPEPVPELPPLLSPKDGPGSLDDDEDLLTARARRQGTRRSFSAGSKRAGGGVLTLNIASAMSCSVPTVAQTKETSGSEPEAMEVEPSVKKQRTK